MWPAPVSFNSSFAIEFSGNLIKSLRGRSSFIEVSWKWPNTPLTIQGEPASVVSVEATKR